MRTLLSIFIASLLALNSYAQNDTTVLSNFTVTDDALYSMYSEQFRSVKVIKSEELENIQANDIPELLDHLAGLDVRMRGVDNIQSDISIRGGTFDQVLILINGIPMSDPQTGHHNMNLPVSFDDIERIEILYGPGSKYYGPNALTGAINIITKTPKAGNEVSFSTQVAQHKTLSSFAGLRGNYKATSYYLSVNNSVSSGYIPNTDYNLQNVYGYYQILLKRSTLNLQAGTNSKEFGANSFYTAKFPEQFEAIKTHFAAAKWKLESPLNMEVSAWWRQNNDRFELFRNEAPSWYKNHNYHQTNVFGASLNGKKLSVLGLTRFGASWTREGINSNVLGVLSDSIAVPGEDSAWFTKATDRTNLSAFLEQSVSFLKFSLSAGVLAHLPDYEDLKIYPSFDFAYDLTKKAQLYASYSSSFRQPTFTDLYYSGPTNIGNPDLKPEQAQSIEAGLKYWDKSFNASISAFKRYGKNMIDWVKHPDSTLWQAQNLTELETSGLEFQFVWKPSEKLVSSSSLKNLTISYTWLNQNKSTESDLISYYVMDHLKHKVTATLKHQFGKKFSLNWDLSYFQRNGTYTSLEGEKEYPDYILLDARLNFLINSNLSIYTSASNITNSEYFDISGVILPGRWYKAGIKLKLTY